MKPHCSHPIATARCSPGLLFLLTVCLVAPAALAADRPPPAMQPGAPRSLPARPSRAPAERADPRLAAFKRELASYKTSVAALQREVQHLQAQQRRLHALARQLPSVGEDGQMLQLELQQTMNKQQQVIQTLSNILKKTGETQDSIVHNIK